MPIQKSYSVNFGSRKTGLTTVGYSLNGAPRVGTGVVEKVPGSGIYSALIAHDPQLTGPLVWDTGEAQPHFAVEDLNPAYVAASGLDGVTVEPATVGGVALSVPQSLSVLGAVLAGKTAQDLSSNTISFFAMGNPGVLRVSALGSAKGDRQTVTVAPPPTS